ncbi:hypothetical protein [uncultured Demequina sp.]|uniref:hypothetical protein n=1 Tax=uncultured Demequina sp. TaxID=693499 RepID=UPI0025DFCC22|nr:hypothetical protein [uncultured Demequina sp.]
MLRHVHGRWAGIGIAAIAGVVMLGGARAHVGWLVVIALPVLVLGVGWSIRDGLRARRLRDAYASFADAHGWEYVRMTREYGVRFDTFPFATGVRRRQESLVRGDYGGVRCATFAHVFETETDDDHRSAVATAHQVTLAELPVALPRLDIVPEGIAAQVAKGFGGGDVDVESHAFNRRWRVRADDARYAHAVLDPRMVERLLQVDAEGLALRIEGGAVLTWQQGRQGPEELSRRLSVVTSIAKRIPEHVLREYRERGLAVRDGVSAHAPAWATEPGHLTGRRPTALAGVTDGEVQHRADAGGSVPVTRADVGGERAAPAAPTAGPAWASESGALTTGRYTGVGVDADGDGVEDWRQLRGGSGAERQSG